MTFLFILLCLTCLGLGFYLWDIRQKHSACGAELAEIKGNLESLERKAKANAEQIIVTAKQSEQKVHERIRELEKELGGLIEQIDQKSVETKRLNELHASLRRRIDGVTEEYVLPIHDLLDGLAEDFSHERAGAKLKEARDKSRGLIKEKKAVTCDWGNDAYKRDAIRLMLETFDAQVDVALEGLKRDENAGKVMQEIRDIYTALNDYGTRCMRASVEKAYLNSRLAEAKWGAVAAELKHKQREEQRELAAKMREEAKVQREIDRARKEAEEEEARARRAMEKAEAEARKKEQQLKAEHDRRVRELEQAMREAEKQSVAERQRIQAEIAVKMAEIEAQAAQASAAERARHEQERLELERRLAEAEAEGERALSMAQQTKRGNVYVISNPGSFGDSMLKIGMTRRLVPQDRIDELGDASVPFDFEVHAMISSEDAPALEYELHKAFAEQRVNKVNHRKEFFRVTVRDVKEMLEKRDIHASWTMVAVSREHQETLIWEERMRQDPAQKRIWAEQFGARRINFADVEPSPPK